ncbi:MAG: ATP-binding cassette domain-containing protein [Magnetococcales bacterium]|nr:ATP-binding cassette domain-containing protein [Magnetococcales bacterium]
MPLIQLAQVTLALGGPPLLDEANLVLDKGERVCLIGRNGMGKTTLLRLLAGEMPPDQGEVVRAPGLRIARLPQEVPELGGLSTLEVVARGFGDEAGRAVAAWHQMEKTGVTGCALTPDQVHDAMLHLDGWGMESAVLAQLTRMQLDGSAPFASLSGGTRRRVLLAQALVTSPDLLLLDEPTNHLDIQAVEWLENFLLTWPQALLFVTHDRAFLRRLATRILELDRGRLTSWPGNYQNYLDGKQAALEVESKQNALFDKKLALEEVWIRKGVKERRTRNEGRVRALLEMRKQRRARRDTPGSASFTISDGQRSGRLVIEARKLTYAWENKPIVRDFSTTILRGDKVGIIGPNGCGKTTLINLLLGRIAPESGNLRLGSGIEVCYFDQHRSVIDPNVSVMENLSDGGDTIRAGGRSRHLISYLQEFLFTPDQARAPASTLSGGERNRLMLARLFAKPSNLLVLDEPTNDLDVETLELLEEQLLLYPGTVLLVSHDRAFLDNVVTSIFIFQENGLLAESVGGYEDWLAQRPEADAPAGEESRKTPSPTLPPRGENSKKAPATKRLSFRENRELEELPPRIEQLEREIATLQTRLAAPDYYRRPPAEINTDHIRLGALETELAALFHRWESLEARSSGPADS